MATGILVMGGGLIIAAAVLMSRIKASGVIGVASGWAWLLSFFTVVVSGYYIEINAAYYGAGVATAPGANADAIFTWFHQNIGLFLFPALVLVLLAVKIFVDRRYHSWIGWLTIAGTSVIIAGGASWVFNDPVLHGSGYYISATGLIVVGLAILLTLWRSIRQGQVVEPEISEVGLKLLEEQPAED